MCVFSIAYNVYIHDCVLVLNAMYISVGYGCTLYISIGYSVHDCVLSVLCVHSTVCI